MKWTITNGVTDNLGAHGAVLSGPVVGPAALTGPLGAPAVIAGPSGSISTGLAGHASIARLGAHW